MLIAVGIIGVLRPVRLDGVAYTYQRSTYALADQIDS